MIGLIVTTNQSKTLKFVVKHCYFTINLVHAVQSENFYDSRSNPFETVHKKSLKLNKKQCS